MTPKQIKKILNKYTEPQDMDYYLYGCIMNNQFDELAKEIAKKLTTTDVVNQRELLQAFKKDDVVLLDNKVKVRVIIPEPKVLIDEEESGCKMWVETKRLVKQE